MSLHAMVDIETLGNRPGSVVTAIGAVKFDSAGIHSGPFDHAIDVFSSLMAGLSIDVKTVEWWRQQSDDAKCALVCGAGLLSVLGAFSNWLDGVDYVWAKGPDYDLVLIDAAYSALGLKRPWRYNAARDVRTVLDLSAVEVFRLGTQHRALDDAVNQANAVIKAYELLGKTL